MTVLLVILDARIVNIALPRVSADLEIDAASQQWIVTAYSLTFGGFLLLGGWIADFWGRKRTCLVGAGMIRSPDQSGSWLSVDGEPGPATVSQDADQSRWAIALSRAL